MKANQLHCCDPLLRTNSHPCCLHPAAVIQPQCFRAGLAEITLCTQGPQAKAPPPELSSVSSGKLCSPQRLWNAAVCFGSAYPLHKSGVPESNFSFPKWQMLWSSWLGKESQPVSPWRSLYSPVNASGAESSPPALGHVSDSTDLKRDGLVRRVQFPFFPSKTRYQKICSVQSTSIYTCVRTSRIGSNSCQSIRMCLTELALDFVPS